MRDKVGFYLSWFALFAMLLVCVAASAGCASTAPAATPAFDVPVAEDEAPAKCCANENCTCDVCSGDCQCGALTDNQREAIRAQLLRLETNLEVVKEELALAKKEKADDDYKPVKVNGFWYCIRNGVTHRYETVFCFNDQPCQYDWVPVPELKGKLPTPQQSVLKQRAACPTCPQVESYNRWRFGRGR